MVNKEIAKISVAIFVTLVANFLFLRGIEGQHQAPFRNIIGKTRSEVTRIGNQPYSKFYHSDPRFFRKGYGKPSRTEFVECWLTYAGMSTVYIYFNADGEVEGVEFRGG